MAGISVDEFLNRCQQSGDGAYGAIRSVLERLEDPKTRTEARIFLSDIYKRVGSSEKCLETYHFHIQDIFLDQYEGYDCRKKLTMMVIPSIFIPEDWSFTFYEGLNRHPNTIFKDKTVAELGCGNGWISIALAAKWLPSKVYGLDINPRAVKVSWINLYLNALDENGQPVYDYEKKTLLDRVEFYESDLLGYCRDNKIQLDRIVGCIPQILNPNPDAMSKMITENASEDFLHSLSNYCALQGFVEDQFGLGLIARAVEEGIAVSKPTGIMIFNMGGRPGQAVCRHLFERRGIRVTQLWQTKILQAADTDISALVEIERNSPHRFEFFMGLSGDQPICARTAWAYGNAGGRISHALSVFSCQLRQPNQVKMIFDFLKNGFEEISSSLDLSFEDEAVADEKIPFLAYLANVLKTSSYFPFEPPAGSKRFCSLISGFMRTYHRIPINQDNIVVFPSRAVAIESALRLLSPQLAIVDEHLTRQLPRSWLTSLTIKNTSPEASEDQLTVIEAPHQSDLMIELIKKLKPQVVVTGMAQFEVITSSSFVHLLDVTREIGSRLFLDISDHFELSSLPASNGVLKYLAENPLPSHAAIVCGLVKNKVYSDLEVAFIISEENGICEAFSKTVEVLEGHTAIISQSYYGCLFHELLAFQLTDRHPPAERGSEKTNSGEIVGFSSSVVSVLKDAELSVTEMENAPLIHMDVDQSFLPIPRSVKAAIFESFVRQNISEAEVDVTPSIKQFVHSNYGFPTGSSTGFIYADCSQALFNKLVLCCAQEGGTFCLPAGSNGIHVASAKFLKANVVKIPTESNDGFKVTETTLTKVLETVKKPWVCISGPTVNPTGMIYSNEEMEVLLSACAKLGARVIIDTSFSGLEYKSASWGGWNLEKILSKLHSISHPSFSVSLLGCLSLNLLSGVLKLSYVVLDHSLVDAFYTLPGLSKPHSTVKYAIKKLLALEEEKAGELLNAIEENVKTLEIRSKRLKEVLESTGWEVIMPSAGISLMAKPTAYINKTVKVKNHSDDQGELPGEQEVKLMDSNIRDTFLRHTGICINSGAWTGVPDYCRFSFALEDSEFEKAIGSISQFKSVLSG
ncbi:PREDICTED: LOW QUALITY PROTEIN: methionine S-methyltransferase-like [Tarenaya hassleriana]|uniref:LOW QUALITY PROTEIN: methionine S-methyltransferase-like n=1 Tax=Tarenaya hassleriana TaxID=28532 RepID=UPI00053C54BA|nr:PREDICTED: LOW QUALITY PROTEIN: methionine S-methyltransferase-like [Tarenaya hassleriana]